MIRFGRSVNSVKAFFWLLFVLLLMPGCSEKADESPKTTPASKPVAAQVDEELSQAQLDMIEELEALGYLGGTELAPVEKLVTQHDRDAAYAGYNVLHSGHRAEALLMDMQGSVLHRWALSYEEMFPGDRRAARVRADKRHWRQVRMLDGGDLLVTVDGVGVARIDRDSQVLWALPGVYHHDFDIDSQGNVWTLRREARVDERIHSEKPVLHDFVSVIDPERPEEVKTIPLYEAFLDSEFADLMAPLRENADKQQDLFHSNSIEIIAHTENGSPQFRPGNILISMRTYNIVAVLDPDLGKIVWAQVGPWKRQHDATLLTNGNLMVFDNAGGMKRFGRTRVIEYDFDASEIVWSYDGSEDHRFHSGNCGANQRLPNGNTLITESNMGRAFEVTPAGEIVWWYTSPYRTGENQELIPKLFRIERMRFPAGLDWLE